MDSITSFSTTKLDNADELMIAAYIHTVGTLPLDLVESKINDVRNRVESLASEILEKIRLSYTHPRSSSKPIKISSPVYLDIFGAVLFQFIFKETHGITVETIFKNVGCTQDHLHFFGPSFNHLERFKTKFRVVKPPVDRQATAHHDQERTFKTIQYDQQELIEKLAKIKIDPITQTTLDLSRLSTIDKNLKGLLSNFLHLPFDNKTSAFLSALLKGYTSNSFSAPIDPILLKPALKKELDSLIEIYLQEMEKNPSLLEQYIASVSLENLYTLYQKVVKLNLPGLQKLVLAGIETKNNHYG